MYIDKYSGNNSHSRVLNNLHKIRFPQLRLLNIASNNIVSLSDFYSSEMPIMEILYIRNSIKILDNNHLISLKAVFSLSSLNALSCSIKDLITQTKTIWVKYKNWKDGNQTEPKEYQFLSKIKIVRNTIEHVQIWLKILPIKTLCNCIKYSGTDVKSIRQLSLMKEL